MNQNQIVFILDAGNTRLKLGVFSQGNLLFVERFPLKEIDKMKELAKNYGYPPVFISSVLNETDTQDLIQAFSSSILFTDKLRLPITLNYLSESKNTGSRLLGKDRIANAVGAHAAVKNKNSVVIDIGTCIKFDFTTSKGEFQGGSISPGIHLRYKSLNDYTGNLPLFTSTEKIDFTGNSTESCIISGVLNGIQGEINHFIKHYNHKMKGLTFFVTGGDAEHFDFPLKNNIFVDENLTLKGLYLIYMMNAK